MMSHKTIGILLPHLNAGYDMDVLAGAHTIAHRHGVQLIAVWGSPGDPRVASLAAARADGWIVVLNVPRAESIRELTRMGMPLVVIGARVPDLDCPAILPDNYGGTLAAVRHLLDHGHRRIAFVGDLRVDDMRERCAAYQAALAERGISVDPRLILGDATYYDHAGGGVAARQIIQGRFPCSAIVAGNDLYALTVLKTVRELGYRVPDDLAVVGFDDLAEAQCATPPLTTVRQLYPALGRVAAELLLDRLRGQPCPSDVTYVPTTLVIRRSCGCTTPQDFADLGPDHAYSPPGWQSVVAERLVRMALPALPADSTMLSEQVWPRAVTLVAELESSVMGERAPQAAGLERAWREAVAITADLEVLDAMLRLLERAGEQLVAAAPDQATARARLRMFLDSARLELMRALQTHQLSREHAREELVRASYAIGMTLLGQEQLNATRLDWLAPASLSWACLGLWTEPGEGESTLTVAGTYSRGGEHALTIGARYAAAEFPPQEALPPDARGGGTEVLILLPVRTATHDWGMLAVCRPPESRSAQTTPDEVVVWATLLGMALERESLLESLTGQQDTLNMVYEQRLITQNIRDLIFMIDQRGRFLYVSPSFQSVLGYLPTGMLGISAFDLVHPDDLATVQGQWMSIGIPDTPDTLQITFRFRHADHSWRWLEASGTIIVRQGRPAIVVIGRDISERKRLEAEVLQAQKIESIGQLAGGVAHDFNNLLTAIAGYADLCAEPLAPADPMRRDLEEIQKAAERGVNLTKRLLAFARKQVIEPRVLNLNDLILDMDRLLRRLIGADIELMALPARDLRHVKVDRGQIEQLLVNLAINARDAMPDGGRLTIETANVVIDHAQARAHIGLIAGAYVRLVIQDTGIGMDAEVRAHLFEPFFTTKGPGRGTGLGLATCYGIVKQHGGHISIDSVVGQGTQVSILLPPAEDSEAPHEHMSPSPAAPGAETVLLVEDEPAVRSLAARVLHRHGYAVLEAANGEEALRLAREYGGTIDLLLTDVVMPQLGGKAVAERLQVMRPGIKVLFMSGYIDKAIDEGRLDTDSVFLQKPFAPNALARKVREVLDAGDV